MGFELAAGSGSRRGERRGKCGGCGRSFVIFLDTPFREMTPPDRCPSCLRRACDVCGTRDARNDRYIRGTPRTEIFGARSIPRPAWVPAEVERLWVCDECARIGVPQTEREQIDRTLRSLLALRGRTR